MELFYPMVISAVAVLATLVYTSYLDIRDRRVPFIHWLPMLAIGIVCTGWLIWQKTANLSLLFGYLALVASFLYADYLDNRGRTDSLGLTGYYKKSAIWYYLAGVLILVALSWFVLAPSVNIQLVPWYAMLAGIFLYVSYREYRGTPPVKARKGKKRPEINVSEAIERWYFVLIILIFAITGLLQFLSPGGWGSPALLVLLPAVFCGVFYIFGRMHLFGGADAWALIFISFAVPTFPFTPLLGNPPLGFLSFSVLINALILNLAAPVAIFVLNLVRGNRAPLMYMFFGFPVQGDRIQESWGFVMEDFDEKDGKISRKFIGFSDSLRRMYAGTNRVYTKDLREHPGEFTKELSIYKKAGTVWISYAVPFIIPITAGFITAIIFGDFLLAIMQFLT
ncbi:A24 family peptidase C-terminal domain-containing protein [uncultured Methanoregula sp.]|uniref:A24 family peptidase C-terminal domain-containing protein n=1 Tax=uncultured Methanoregula sp. TaxID=1005933 RepID=UPI002AAB65AB|nr:A24 family peptidase C-terminal domain-containing protein [uncultured Methanoregula sp.]